MDVLPIWFKKGTEKPRIKSVAAWCTYEKRLWDIFETTELITTAQPYAQCRICASVVDQLRRSSWITDRSIQLLIAHTWPGVWPLRSLVLDWAWLTNGRFQIAIVRSIKHTPGSFLNSIQNSSFVATDISELCLAPANDCWIWPKSMTPKQLRQ